MIALTLSRTTTTFELGYSVLSLSHLYGAAQCVCPMIFTFHSTESGFPCGM